MEKKWMKGLGALVLLVWVGNAAVHAQAPNGWIQTQNWNLLFPLNQSGGATGGGAANMLGNWVAPHDIGSENPRALEVWNDIDFGGAALATGWAATPLNADPIWVTLEAAEAALSLAAGTLPNGDVVDFQALVDSINTNWVQMQPGPPADIVSDNVLGLATTYVENTTGAPLVVDICSASDDSIQVWVNNVVATNHSEARGTAGDCAERNPAVLPPGISKLAVLVWEGTGGWGFRLALEVDGVKVTSADQDPPVVFLGPGTDQTGQEQYGIMRSRDPLDPLECAGGEDVEISLTGNGVGAAGDALTVVESVRYAQGADITINAPGATVGDIIPVDDRRSVGIFDDHRVIGNPDCTDVGAADPSGSDTTLTGDVYTQSAAGNSDVWNGGDTFEYAYNRYDGDFDMSIKITSLSHLESTNDWSKVGLMVRDELVNCSRHYFQCLPYPNSRRQVQARSVEGSCNDSFSNENYAQVGGADVSNRAIYHRVTRRSGVIQGWVTDDAGVETDPTNDALWGGSEATETWAGEGPVYVGLATSEHSSDCGVMVMECQVLNATGTPVSTFDPSPIGKTLTYETTRGAVNDGLSYTISTASAVNASMSGEATVGGAPEAFVGGLVSSVSLVFEGNTGPVGAFDDARDIGNPPIAGSISDDGGGAYTITGSGNDIWDGGDDFYFAYQYVTGDFVAQMRVLTRSVSPERWGRHGIMARYDCTRGSKFSMAETQAPTAWGVDNLPQFGGAEDWPRHHFRLFHRNNGNNRDYYQVNDGIFPTETRLPTWMRLVRIGNALYSYMAEDANEDGEPDKWCLVGSDSALGVPDELLVGVAIHGRANQATTITFDNWSVMELGPPEDAGTCLAADQLQLLDYESADQIGIVVVRGGGFTPSVVNGRLRLTEDGIASSANAVWYGVPAAGAGAVPLLDDGFAVEFDAFMTKTIADPPQDSNPADGMSFAVVASGVSDGLAGAVGPFPPGLDVASLGGDGGGALGFDAGTLRERTECHPSFAIEMDNWVGGGEPGNEPPDGGQQGGTADNPDGEWNWHAGLDINASVSSIQTNVDNGVPTGALPNIYAPEGIHVEMLYLPTGEISVWMSGVDLSGAEVPRTQVLSAEIPPLPSGDVVLGFTGGTGGATTTQEIDNFRLSAICCEEPDAVEISGPVEVNQGETHTYTADVTGADGDVTYSWEVVSGSASLSATDTETVDVTFDGADTEIVLGVTVDDGTCESGAAAELVITVIPGTPFIRGDCNQDGEVCGQVSDIIRIIEITFLGRDAPDCPAACDANGDGEAFADTADALYIANYCFLGSENPPPAPYPDCDYAQDAECDGVTFCTQ